ncbi:FAD-dependent oxidoreductase [Paenibacillus sp. IB182496]|uniref:FAD-dependent oxidoreductase n=1 Tax=Paenibacillus sabuli TaxID=2772509 RepID=A0A927GTC3_9BACL|nr:FAD-dependent oxidoreductase [Paenibacillus sabuli]MBD2846572.1 FAD-dependent oxidoreductase [Paenibacillus sabuli]
MGAFNVIGGGILGAATAYELARQGAKVTLIDRADRGQATAAAAGIICPWVSQRRNQVWYRLAKAGARYYPELIAQLRQEGEADTGYAQVGALSLRAESPALDRLQERAELRSADAPEMGELTRLDARAVREQFPLLAEGYQAVRIGGAARVDGRALRDALIRSAVRHGAELVYGSAALRVRGKRVVGADADGRPIAADATLVCAGAWARELLMPLGIGLQVGYQKAQIMHLQLEDAPDTGRWPVIMPPTDQYLLAFAHGRIVIGATHENEVEGYDTRPTAGGMQELLHKGLQVAPGLTGAAFAEMRVGLRPFTPGFLPVAGAVPGWSGLYAANGLGSSGLTVGPFLGSQLARLALGRATVSLSDYSLGQVIDLV